MDDTGLVIVHAFVFAQTSAALIARGEGPKETVANAMAIADGYCAARLKATYTPATPEPKNPAPSAPVTPAESSAT